MSGQSVGAKLDFNVKITSGGSIDEFDVSNARAAETMTQEEYLALQSKASESSKIYR